MNKIEVVEREGTFFLHTASDGHVITICLSTKEAQQLYTDLETRLHDIWVTQHGME